MHPLRVSETCSHCHADAQKMAKYKIPTNQFQEYHTSVHWEALSKRGDLSAPTCASCHGNHGAKPPQVESVSAVCGSCHVLFEKLYDKSVHNAVFSGAGGGGGCMVCHSNHAVHYPSTAMLAGPKAVCSGCHDAGTAPAGRRYSNGWVAGWPRHRVEAVRNRADEGGKVRHGSLRSPGAPDRWARKSGQSAPRATLHETGGNAEAGG